VGSVRGIRADEQRRPRAIPNDRALFVASSIGASVSSVASKATYFDAGVKYLFLPFKGGYQPYATPWFRRRRVGQGRGISASTARSCPKRQLQDQYGRPTWGRSRRVDHQADFFFSAPACRAIFWAFTTSTFHIATDAFFAKTRDNRRTIRASAPNGFRWASGSTFRHMARGPTPAAN